LLALLLLSLPQKLLRQLPTSSVQLLLVLELELQVQV
jgi:hypothetical protein